MIIGKIKSNLILSICVKKFHPAREHVKDAGPLGSRAPHGVEIGVN